jgi:hypothetical protein
MRVAVELALALAVAAPAPVVPHGQLLVSDREGQSTFALKIANSDILYRTEALRRIGAGHVRGHDTGRLPAPLLEGPRHQARQRPVLLRQRLNGHTGRA